MSQVLYRKYRSQDLSDVVGQPHITSTLEAALKKGRIAHAYLLCGPRGTGKTSVARILARRINELPADADMSSYLDIVEIDAASNRGIDEIRTLREGVSAAASQLRYKVYIIDEVHMLTREAFNALLKTLEEPPEHVVFVLATTEVHKLPETIISRTQRFDFRAIAETDLVAHLRKIADAEQIAITDEALVGIAALSAGGFRDAIGLLDQLSVLDDEIGADTVAEFFGRADAATINQLLELALSGDRLAALALLSDLQSKGFRAVDVTTQLIEQVHRKLADKSVDAVALAQAGELLQKAMQDFKLNAHPSLPLELAIVRMNSAKPSTVSAQVEPTAVSADQPAIKTDPKTAEQDMPSDEADDKKLAKALSMIKHHNNSLYAVLRSAELSVSGNRLMAKFRFNFHRERLEDGRNRAMVEQCLSKAFGRAMEIHTSLLQPKQDAAQPPATSTVASKKETEDELVSAAMSIFKGEMIDGE